MYMYMYTYHCNMFGSSFVYSLSLETGERWLIDALSDSNPTLFITPTNEMLACEGVTRLSSSAIPSSSNPNYRAGQEMVCGNKWHV